MRKKFESACDVYVSLWEFIERRRLDLIAEYVFIAGFALLFFCAACYGHSDLQAKLMTPDNTGYTMYKIESRWLLPIVLHVLVIAIFTVIAHVVYFLCLICLAIVFLWVCGAVYLVVAIPEKAFRNYCVTVQKKRIMNVNRGTDSERAGDVAGH